MQIEYIYVDANTTKYRIGFIRAYKEAFGGHPYYEVYTDSEIIDDPWAPHLANGIIVVACEDESVVGFGCAIPLLKSPDKVQKYLRTKQVSKDLSIESSDFKKIKFSDTWYISELGVCFANQNQGIGTQLIKFLLSRILEHQCHYFVTRTAGKTSNSIGIFKKVGGKELPEPQDVSSSDQVQVNKSQSTERVYLYGRCERNT